MFAAIEAKYLLKLPAIIWWFDVNLSLIFIIDILLTFFILLLIVHVILDLFSEFDNLLL
jgi:hypothetical protein